MPAAKGVLVPLDLSAYEGEQRALDTTAGTGAIVTKLSTDLISILRNHLVTASMGATVLSDMLGPFAIPRQNQAATGYWVAEGSAPTASNQTIDQVTFTPKTVGAYTDYTRRFLEQTSVAAEQFVRNDLMQVIARAVETAALNGSGSSNQPTGVGQNSNVTTVSIGANGGNPTWATLIGMESALATANADLGRLGYIVNAKTRGYLKQAPKIGSTFPVFLWDGTETPINGYPAGVTNILPSNLTKGSGTGLSMMLFGNWNDLLIALWSGVDLLTDPYTGSSTGNVRVVALQDVDINVRHPESFAKVVDVQTS
jgi:HK97 family phage major capsid protein